MNTVSVLWWRRTGLWLGALAALFLFHFSVLMHYSVNIPFMDEWDNLPPKRLSWDWLWQQHNEHRIVLTKLETWILYRLTNWDVNLQVALNFLIFGLLVYSLDFLLKRTASRTPRWAQLFSLTFLLSPMFYQNHHWAFQSQFHFFLLFGILALLSLASGWGLAGSLALAALSMISFSAGVVFCAGILGVWVLFEFQRKSFARGIFVGLGFALLCAVWFHGYQSSVSPWPRLFPNDLRFWRFFLNLISLGYGILGRSFPLGILGGAAEMVVLALTLWGWKQNPRSPRWAVFLALQGGLLGCLAVIASGRASIGIDGSKSSRYAEIAVLLVPVTICVLGEFSDRTRRSLPWVALALVVTFMGDWRFTRIYRGIQADKLSGVECLREYYAGRGEPLCLSIYSGPAKAQFDQARERGFSSVRGL